MRRSGRRERIRQKIDAVREEVWRNIFDYTELFINPKHRHGHANPALARRAPLILQRKQQSSTIWRYAFMYA